MTRRIATWVGAAVLVACGADPAEPAGPPGPASGPRIVTLAPHLTELVYSAGAGDRLVGVVAHSDFPPAARDLPVIGDAFRIDPERLAAAAPDLVLAWEGGNPAAAIEQIESRGYRVERLRTATLGDVADNLETIGRLAGSSAVAAARAAAFREGLAALRRRHAHAEAIAVFYQISPQPLYTIGGGHPIDAMIGLCGGANIFADIAQPAPIVSLEDVIGRDPDVIVIADDAPEADRWRRWQQMTAVQHDNLCRIDPSLVARPGVRMLDGARAVCDCLQDARQRLAR